MLTNQHFMTKEMMEDSIPRITTFYISNLLGNQINRNVPCNITLGPHRFTVHSLPRSVEATIHFDKAPIHIKRAVRQIGNFIFSKRSLYVTAYDTHSDGSMDVSVTQYKFKHRWAKNFYKMQEI